MISGPRERIGQGWPKNQNKDERKGEKRKWCSDGRWVGSVGERRRLGWVCCQTRFSMRRRRRERERIRSQRRKGQTDQGKEKGKGRRTYCTLTNATESLWTEESQLNKCILLSLEY